MTLDFHSFTEIFSFTYIARAGWLGILTVFLDLFLMTFIIYRFLLFVRGTRAFLMLVGLSLLILLSTSISYSMNLFTIQWLLDNLYNYLFIFIIVIFQNEIRRLLTMVGQGVPFMSSSDEAMEVLDEVAEAVDRLAQTKTGAIIVFERKAELINLYLAGGKVIDSKITRELIWSIFRPSSENPLHDGAVVISKNKLHRAGVLLPLSERKLDSKYGTRHRAALGITEAADAISVVVSEERGHVSICENGKITKMENITRLRSELSRLIRQQKITPSGWWKKRSKTSSDKSKRK